MPLITIIVLWPHVAVARTLKNANNLEHGKCTNYENRSKLKVCPCHGVEWNDSD